VLVPALALLQLCALAYDPRRSIPTARDRAAGHELLALLETFPGDVYLTAHGHLPTLVGKRTFAHEQAIDDVIASGGEPARALAAELRRALDERRFDAVVTDTGWSKALLKRGYRRRGEVFQEKRVFATVTGMRMRPEHVYVPRSR
jgi:hypothetical protein